MQETQRIAGGHFARLVGRHHVVGQFADLGGEFGFRSQGGKRFECGHKNARGKIRLARGKGTQNLPKKSLSPADFAGSLCGSLTKENFMARICELTGKRPMKGSIIWRSGKAKKQRRHRHAHHRDHQAQVPCELAAREGATAQRRSPLHPRLRRRAQKRPRHQGAEAHLEKGRRSQEGVKA